MGEWHSQRLLWRNLGEIYIGLREKVFTVTVVRHWNGFAQKGGGYLIPGDIQSQGSEHPDVDVAVCPFLLQGRWTKWCIKVPFNWKVYMILWQYVFPWSLILDCMRLHLFCAMPVLQLRKWHSPGAENYCDVKIFLV